MENSSARFSCTTAHPMAKKRVHVHIWRVPPMFGQMALHSVLSVHIVCPICVPLVCVSWHNHHWTPNQHTSLISTTSLIGETWASIFSHDSAPLPNCGCGAPRVTESETCRICDVLAASRLLNYGARPPPPCPSPRYNTCASPSCLMNTESVTCDMYTLPTANTSSVACNSK